MTLIMNDKDRIKFLEDMLAVSNRNLNKYREETAALHSVLGQVKACAKIYLSQYEGVYDMAIPEPFQSPDAKRAETNLRTILSQSPEVLAVVDGYKLEALDWPFIVQEECGDALLGIWETEPSEGWTNTPVTAIIIKKGGTA